MKILVPEITHVLCLKSGEVFAKGEKEDVLIRKESNYCTKIKNLKKKRKEKLIFPQKKKIKRDHDAVIMMKNINVRYGNKVVFENFNWTVRNGDNWKIVGPNGAGKSTLLSLITADNLQVYSNEIHMFGKQRGTGESIWDIKRRIGFVSPEFQVQYRESVSVLRVVFSGFFDTIGLYQAVSKKQKEIALKWMKFLEIENISRIDFNQLSTDSKDWF